MADSPISIAIAVVERDGCFLIGRRPAGVALAGMWEFPGGKVESGESPRAAAQRECWEETGVAIRVVDAYPEHVHRYEHGRVKLHFFACAPEDDAGEARPPFRWVPRGELSRYEFPAGNRGLLELLTGMPSK